MFRMPAGLASLLKEGTRHFKGQEEAVYRNIEAAKKLRDVLEPCFGPTSMSKLLNNHLDKRFLSSDACTLLTELEVQHPAGRVLVLNAQMQNTEFGDGTNYVVLLAGELLLKAGELMHRQGVHLSSIIQGYELALTKCLSILQESSIGGNSLGEKAWSKEWLLRVVQPVLVTKVRDTYSSEAFAGLVVEGLVSALSALEDKRGFNTDNLRVTKLVGGSLDQSELVNGMVLQREPKTVCREKRECKVIVLATALEITGTEGSSTVLLKKAEDMLNFSKTEEAEMEDLIRGYHEAGVEAIICGGAISPLALHYLDQYGMWAVATPSKFDIKRLARTLGIPALQRMTTPMAEEIAVAELCGVQEFSSQLVTVVRAKDTQVSTYLLRGATRTVLDEAERAIDDAVSLVKATTKDQRFLPGGGAIETHLASQLQTYAHSLSGVEQYAVTEFAQAFIGIVTILAENAGQNAMEALTQLKAAHQAGNKNIGLDVTRTFQKLTRDVTKPLEDVDESCAFSDLGIPVYDHFMTKEWAIRLAVDATLTILRTDQIIMSKPAGGPKLPNQGHWDAADDRQPGF